LGVSVEKDKKFVRGSRLHRTKKMKTTPNLLDIISVLSNIGHMKGTPFFRSVRCGLLAAAAMIIIAQTAYGQLPPNNPDLVAYVDDSTSHPAIEIFNKNDPNASCYLRADFGPAESGDVTLVDVRPDYVILTFSTGQILKVPITDFEIICAGTSALRRPLVRPAATPTPTPVQPIVIPTSNDADEFAVSCDGRYAVVAGFSNSGKPVSLVDLQANQEVATISLSNETGHGAAIGDDEHTVIASLNALPQAGSPIVRRLTLENGTLTDSGVQLVFANSFVKDVRIAPGSHIGVVAVSENQGVGNTLLYSFDFPGLTIRDSVTVASQTIETCPAFNCAGDKVYVRTGVGFGNDVIQGFDFDPTTGMFNHTPFLTINNVSSTSTGSFGSTLTVSSDDTLLIAPEKDTSPPRVSQFDAVTGNLVSTFTRAVLDPEGVAMIPCCALGPTPTPTVTPSPTATPTPTPTPTPCTGRCGPTPRPRPTPHPRPSAAPRTSPAGIVNGTIW
jgi:hypothetical protein